VVFQEWDGWERWVRSFRRLVEVESKIDWTEAAQDDRVGSAPYSSIADRTSVHRDRTAMRLGLDDDGGDCWLL